MSATQMPDEAVDVKRVITSLEYDFHKFELTNFVDHIARWVRKPIELVPFPFTAQIFGVWVPAPNQNYIFYNERVPYVHRVHIILHELAHILLNHPRHKLEDVLPPELLQALRIEETYGRTRTAPTEATRLDRAEQESEEFVLIVQRSVVKANLLSELTQESSSIAAFKPVTDSMGYNS
jgi:hypothetical protein